MNIKKFKFEIGGYFSNNYEIELQQGGEVVFRKETDDFHRSEEIILSPPPKVIQKLEKFLADCNWREEYSNPVCDGEQWGLKATIGDKELNVYGSNCYPADFKKFMRILYDMTGFKEFKNYRIPKDFIEEA